MSGEEEGTKILHVDDEPDFLALTKAILERENENFSIEGSTSAEEGVELLKGGKYDVVISDYKMPGMDGLEFLHNLRQSGNNIPFIMFMGKGREEVAMEALNKGVNYYLQKGVDVESMYGTLAHAIKEEVKKKRAEEALRESEERLRAIFEGAQDAIFTKDRDGHYTNVNPACASLFELTVEGMIGKTDFDIFPPEVAQHTREKIDRKVLEKGETVFLEDTKPTAGVMRTFHVVKVPLRDANGEIAGLCGIARDITERKRAKEALEKENEYLLQIERTLAEISSRLIKIEDFDEAVNDILKRACLTLHANRSYLFKIYDDGKNMDNTHEWVVKGTTPQIENLQGLKTSDFPFWMEKLRNNEIINIADVTKMPESARVEREILQQQGILSVLVIPVFVGGELYGFFGFDETDSLREWEHMEILALRTIAENLGKAIEHKQADDALQKSEAKYLDLYENANDIIFTFDLQGRFTSGNKAAQTSLGYQEEELFKTTLFGVLSPEDARLAKAMLQKAVALKSDLTEQQPWKFKAVRKDDSIIDIEVRSRLLWENEQIVGVQGIARDITERKRAEEEVEKSRKFLATIIDNIPDTVTIRDSQHRFVLVNQAYCKITGVAKEEVIGKAAYWEKDKEIFQTGKGLDISERTYTDTEGEWHYVSVNKAPLTDESGKITHILTISRDITERKKVEEEREQLIKELEAKNAEMERFTYTVSHDLRSPLVTIQGFVGMLREDLKRNEVEKVESDLKFIENSATKMDRLLTDTLQLSRIGRMVNPSEDVPFGELVHEALVQTAEQIKSSGVEVSVAEDFPAVHVDRMRIGEVLVNLITNSINYMGEQPSPKIDIGYRVDGEETVFFVRDNGIGMDKSQHEKVFELFYKVDKSSKGTGAGLAIVKRIIGVHEGRIWIESEKGKGCTVCFTLPVA